MKEETKIKKEKLTTSVEKSNDNTVADGGGGGELNEIFDVKEVVNVNEYSPNKENYHPIKDACWKKNERCWLLVLIYILKYDLFYFFLILVYLTWL